MKCAPQMSRIPKTKPNRRREIEAVDTLQNLSSGATLPSAAARSPAFTPACSSTAVSGSSRSLGRAGWGRCSRTVANERSPPVELISTSGCADRAQYRLVGSSLEAIDKLAAAYVSEPGDLSGGGKSRAIRDALLAAAARIDEKGGK